MTQAQKDIHYMKRAIALAERAQTLDEVPVGAVIVRDDTVIAEGFNVRECARSATGHAELSAIEEGCRTLGGWRLPQSTLYVTLEPCLMCAGAIVAARIDRVVFGARDEKGGAFGGMTDILSLPVNHKPTVTSGVLKEECAALLRRYFEEKRHSRPPFEKFVL